MSEGYETLHARICSSRAELAAPRLTRGNDTPANRAFIQNRSWRVFPTSRRTTRAASGRYQTLIRCQSTGRGRTPFRLDWNCEAHQHASPADTSGRVRFAGDRGYHRRRAGAPEQHAAKTLGSPGRTLIAARPGRGGRATASGSRDTNVNIAAGNDTPIIRFAGSPGLGLDHRQRRQLPDRSRPDRPSVRLQRLAAVGGRITTFKAGTDLRFQHLDDLAENF